MLIDLVYHARMLPNNESKKAADNGLFELKQSNGSVLRSAFLAFVLSTVSIALSFLLLHARFETNDDVVMSLLASGLAFGSPPDFHILYSHVVIGAILSKLYSLNQHIPWYGLYLTTANLVSTTVICFCFLFGRATKKSILFFLGFYIVAILHIVTVIQFTTSAALMCIAAVFLLIRLGEDGERNLLGFCTASALLVFGSFIRIESFQLISVLAAFLFVCRDFGKELVRKRVFVVLAVIFALSMCLHKVHVAVYDRDPEWKHFLQTWKDSYKILNEGYTQPVIDESPAAKSVGWTSVDGQMLASWNYIDRDNFSLEKFQRISAALAKEKMPVYPKIRDLTDMCTDLSIMPMALLILLAIPRMQNETRNRFLIFWAGNASLVIGLCIFLKLVPRVYYPIFCLLCLLALWDSKLKLFGSASGKNADSSSASAKPEALRLIAPILLSALLLLLTGGWLNLTCVQPQRLVNRLHDELVQGIENLKPSKNEMYLSWSFPYLGIRPFDDLTKIFEHMTICPVAMLSQSQVYNNVTAHYGIHNIFTELDNPKIRFISSSFENDIFLKYEQLHFGKEYKYEEVCPFGSVKVWRWQSGIMRPFVEGPWCCRPSDAEHVLKLFPNKDHNWAYAGLSEVKKKSSIFASSALFFWKLTHATAPVCQVCKINSEKTGTNFESLKPLPTFSSFGALRVDSREYPHFYIELAVDRNVIVNRCVFVQLNLTSAHPVEFKIPLQADDKMHRYEFDLSKLKLDLPKGELITDMSVHPVYVRSPGEKSKFSLLEFGFVHDKSDRASSPDSN